MREWTDALIAVLLAPICAACQRPLVSPTRGCVCADCWSGIERIQAPFCDRCGEPMAGGVGGHHPHVHHAGSAVDRTRALGLHAGSLRAVIHALKYDARRSVARRLGLMMRVAGVEVLAGAAAVVPVPLHRMRQWSRGFNQADDLARALDLPVCHALCRTRRTAVQANLGADERQTNVEGAFAPTRRARALRGASVVLVDDVRTTGATLEACALTLKRAGVGEVRALTAATAARQLQ